MLNSSLAKTASNESRASKHRQLAVSNGSPSAAPVEKMAGEDVHIYVRSKLPWVKLFGAVRAFDATMMHRR